MSKSRSRTPHVRTSVVPSDLAAVAVDPGWVPCVMKSLPANKKIDGARTAIDINPMNRPREGRIAAMLGDVAPALKVAGLTQKYWGAGGVNLGVAFMESTPADLKARIIEHGNAWGKWGNVLFREASVSQAEIRISRGAGGYYSYLGTDCLSIPKSQQTMNLEAFTMSMSEAEFRRVVRHEFGHTLFFVHEHQRKAIVDLLDPAPTIALYKRTQGWSEAEIRQQILTVVAEALLLNPPPVEFKSIMDYGFPGSITKNRQPIPGGVDITDADGAYCAQCYPKAGGPVQPPPPIDPTGALTVAQVVASLEAIRDAILTRNPQLNAGQRKLIADYVMIQDRELPTKFPGRAAAELVEALLLQ